VLLDNIVRIGLMEFPKRLVALRKERKLSQKKLAELVGIHVTQLRRYEAGTSQPTLDVLRNLAQALRVSADVLLFDEGERGPDDDFRLQFEAICKLDPNEKMVIKDVLDALLLKHEAKRWTA
jgi:transcriptional regulator with XRE-family HTH domain